MDETICSNCGRYVGPETTCPYCRNKIKKRTSVMILKYGSLVAAIAGIILALVLTRYVDYPTVDLYDVKPTMNFAYIQVDNAQVTANVGYTEYHVGAPRIDFTIDDGTKTMDVKMYEATAIELLNADTPENPKIPSMGDRVNLKVQVQCQPDDIRLQLNSPDQIEVIRNVPQTDISATALTDYQYDPNAFAMGTRVNITNLVVDSYAVNIIKDYVITLRDPANVSAKVNVVLPLAVYQMWNCSVMPGHPNMMGDVNTFPDIWAKLTVFNQTGFTIDHVVGNLYYNTYNKNNNWEIVLAYPKDIVATEAI